MLLTTSSISLYRSCPRAYLHRYEQGIRKRGEKAEALAFGTAIHAALEAYWLGKPEQIEPILFEQLQGEELARARAMLDGYALRWDTDRTEHGLRAVAVEASFRCPIYDPRTGKRIRGIERAGKVDAIVVDKFGAHWVLEHKTTSSDVGPGSPYWDRLQVDTQISYYVLGAKALGYDVAGVIYDVLGKPKISRRLATPEAERKYTKEGRLYATQRDVDETIEEYAERVRAAIAERPETYYARAEIFRLEQELSECQLDDVATIQAMRADRKRGHWPRSTAACYRFGARCDYLDVCAGAASIEDSERFENVGAHTELTKETSA